MMDTVGLGNYFGGGNVAYDADYPTRNMEILSGQVISFLEALGAYGATVVIDTTYTNNPQGRLQELTMWQSSVNSWLGTVESTVTNYLLADDDTRALPPALPAFPALPVFVGLTALVLVIPKLVEVGVNVAGTLIKVSQAAKMNRRATELVRLFEKSFMRDSWWGILPAKPFLEEISDRAGEVANLLEQIKDKPEVIRLLHKLVVSASGEIHESEFTMMDDLE